MSFKNALNSMVVPTTTTNGMVAFKSTTDKNMDLFYQIGSSRGKDITNLFMQAYSENPELAIRIAEWVRDVRGGAGERELFRQCLRNIERYQPEVLINTGLLENIPSIGRFDDLLIFTNPQVRARAFEIIRQAILAKNQLCAKWMPRKGQIAAALRDYIGISPKVYRRTLVELTNVVETKMCSQDWTNINFSHVPSNAMKIYSKAFRNHAPAEFESWKNKLSTGETKVNAGALYPYDVTRMISSGSDQVLVDEMWKALPNYIGSEVSMIPLVDVSGSMSCSAGGSSMTCMEVAISLGLYISDKNKGPFKDLFLTFSERSKFVQVKGTLTQKYLAMASSEWGGSTNFQSSFKAILDVAVQNNLPKEDMPKSLIVLSDMQFNQSDRNSETAIKMGKRMFADAGYDFPTIVFWNLNAHNNVPATVDENGVCLVSGFSPSILKSVLEENFDEISPRGIMMSTVMIPRYNFLLEEQVEK